MKPTKMDQLFVNVARKIKVGGHTAKSEICLWGICKAITELWTKKHITNRSCETVTVGILLERWKQAFYTEGKVYREIA